MQKDVLVGDLNQPAPAPIRSLGNNIISTLNKHYPQHMIGWKCRIDAEGGLMAAVMSVCQPVQGRRSSTDCLALAVRNLATE